MENVGVWMSGRPNDGECLPYDARGETMRLLLEVVLFVLGRASTLRGRGLGEVVCLILLGGAVEALLEDGFGLIDVELCLKVAELVSVAAAVGAAAGVDEGKVLVDDLVASSAPRMCVSG